VVEALAETELATALVTDATALETWDSTEETAEATTDSTEETKMIRYENTLVFYWQMQRH